MENFYMVQGWIDGFGHDTSIDRIFPTKKEAENYIRKAKDSSLKIVPGEWGKPIDEIYD